MANREAIRELQARLASRLQAARDEGPGVSWLAIRSAGRNYLLPLAQSGEIFPISPIQHVPYARPWFRGVLNLRGGLYGVVDLARFVGGDMPDHGPATGAVPAPESAVVTINAALNVNCALLVDALAGLRNAESFATARAPQAGEPPYFGNCFTDPAGESWQEINLQTLAQFPRFLNITA
jgi:twitching motility protein PilI